ncbi:MAG: PepSY domain-containing protein [Planctomycetales bacterium]|nr:PepSY domain-containing protein [Planctomycetales bacterium]
MSKTTRTNSDEQTETSETPVSSSETRSPRRRRLPPRLMMLARRTHLYAGLFLLPWVFLYGITGAMFNHQSLFPHVSISPVPRAVIESTPLNDFPSPDVLAAQVVRAIEAASEDASIQLAEDPCAEFTNELMFEVPADGNKHVVHIDPITRQSHVARHPAEDFKPKRLLQKINHIQLDQDPMELAKQSAEAIFKQMDVSPNAAPKPFGWTKLNFLAEVDGQPARVTYVLKDGHVDVTQYEGHHGMSSRAFFLRLHTTHGQPPHWNGRMIWSLFVDTMAIAMVTWGLTGLLMWWQIKRTRIIGGIVVASSIIVAITVYWMVYGFYANTML